jgi:hypothetical protein
MLDSGLTTPGDQNETDAPQDRQPSEGREYPSAKWESNHLRRFDGGLGDMATAGLGGAHRPSSYDALTAFGERAHHVTSIVKGKPSVSTRRGDSPPGTTSSNFIEI